MLKRVIIKQQDRKDCGVCCIQSVLKYYDGYAPLEKIREDTYTTKRGTSAFHMVEVLKQYGFDAYGTRIKKERLESETFPLPAIVHVVLDNGLNHYMVLYEIRKDNVILMDPSSGKKVLSLTDFFWIWSEVAIIVYPKQNIISCPKEKSSFLLFFHFLGKEKKSFILLILFQIVLFFLILLETFYLKLEIQFLEQWTEQIFIFSFFIVILWFKLLGYKSLSLEEKDLNKNLELLHLSSFLEHLLHLPLNTFKSRETSDYYMRIQEQMDLKYLYTDVMKNWILSIGIIFVSFILLYTLNDNFFLFYIIIVLFYFLFQMISQQKSDYYERSFLEDNNHFSNQMLNMLESMETYTYLDLKEKQSEMVERNVISYLKKKYQKEKFYQRYLYFQNILKEVVNFSFLTLGVYFLNQSKMKLVDFFLIQGIGSYQMNALDNIVNLLPKTRYLKHILKKSNSFLSIPIEKQTYKKEDFIVGDIDFLNVSYSYDQYHYSLKDIKLKIIEGSHVLMIGESGCGKSTLCKILTRVLTLSSGEIKVGGINIEDYEPKTVRSNIVYLSQRSNLISATIKENIVMNRSFDLKRFNKICEICHVNEIVSKRPLRFETLVSNEENNLSGGEKQRIMLARTLMSRASIFLLDESLSEVDEKLEKDIIKNLREYLKGKTLIYISHRNHKKLFDEVITLEKCHERVLIS